MNSKQLQIDAPYFSNIAQKVKAAFTVLTHMGMSGLIIVCSFQAPLAFANSAKTSGQSELPVNDETVEGGELYVRLPVGILLPHSACASLLIGGMNSSLQGVLRSKPVEIYEPKAVFSIIERFVKNKAQKEHTGLINRLNEMYERGGVRLLIGPPPLEAFDRLAEEHPNFSEVIQSLKMEAALSTRLGMPMKSRPILLLGSPGIGKTRFANDLAQVIGTGYKLLSFSSLTAGWILSGSDSQWSGAKEGYLSQQLIDGDYANPVITLDEIDKANSAGKNYDPLGSLYSLLENETAIRFKDEYVGVPTDASHVIWIATANYVDDIPEPILNRFDVYEVPDPTREHSAVIANIIYKGILKSNPGSGFAENLDKDVLEKLSGLSPRKMTSVIRQAFLKANFDGRRSIKIVDLKSDKKESPKKPIGFIQ